MKKQFLDTDFDSPLKNLNSNMMWRTKQKKELKNRILADIEKLESQGVNKSNIISIGSKKGRLVKNLAYSCIAFTILFSLFIGSAFISPAMAEVISKLPFLGFDNHNVIQLEKHPSQTKAYLNLVSAYNKGDLEAYLQAFSKDLPEDSKELIKKDFQTRGIEKHQFAATLELIYSDKTMSILLSNEKHSFESNVLYQLDSYVILMKEKEEWKVLNKIPFKKDGTEKYGSKDDFDKNNEIRKELEETYHIKLEK
ncbi:hypothetical protein ACFDTO_35440 [Microbacteriaceae bacterium 4G12]